MHNLWPLFSRSYCLRPISGFSSQSWASLEVFGGCRKFSCRRSPETARTAVQAVRGKVQCNIQRRYKPKSGYSSIWSKNLRPNHESGDRSSGAVPVEATLRVVLPRNYLQDEFFQLHHSSSEECGLNMNFGTKMKTIDWETGFWTKIYFRTKVRECKRIHESHIPYLFPVQNYVFKSD